MLNALYTAMTGMMSSAKGLTTISNNVANINTPGYKARETVFADLFYQFQPGMSHDQSAGSFGGGNGVTTGGEHLNQQQGQIQSTGNSLDVAIDGRGYFMLEGRAAKIYTRAGQFSIDPNGFLSASGSQDHVLFSGGGDRLSALNMNEFSSNRANATALITFTKSLSTTDATYTKNVTAFDSLGGSHTLVIKFTNNAGGHWGVMVSEGANILTAGDISFDGTGKPIPGAPISFLYQPSPSATPSTVTLDFSKATQFTASATGSNIDFTQDGYGAGALTSTNFDTDGTVIFSYSNGQTVRGPRLALANFANEGGLTPIGNNRFVDSSGQRIVIGNPSDSEFGATKGSSIEASNVDLAQQFGELIILQRGYQSSSEVISSANDMIQQLLEMKSKQ